MLKNCKPNQINPTDHKGFVNEGAQVNKNKHISLSLQLQFPFSWLLHLEAAIIHEQTC